MGAGEDQGVGQVEEVGMGEEELDDTDVKKEQASTVEVMSPEMEAELLDLVVSLGNVTCTFNIGCGLNLVELVLHGVNVEMKVGFHLNSFSPFTIVAVAGGCLQQDHHEDSSGFGSGGDGDDIQEREDQRRWRTK